MMSRKFSRTGLGTGKSGFAALVFLATTLCSAGTPASGLEKAPATPDAHRSVWHAVIFELHALGLRDELLPDMDDIEMPAALALAEESSLQVASSCWNQQADRAELQLRCTGAASCLPFLVYVKGREVALGRSSVAKRGKDFDDFLHASAKLCHAGFVSDSPGNPADRLLVHRSLSLASSTVNSSVNSTANSSANSKAAIRAGDHATAIFSSTGLRMSASVTCLDRGAVGEVIRVRNRNGQTFRARVTGPLTLEALL